MPFTSVESHKRRRDLSGSEGPGLPKAQPKCDLPLILGVMIALVGRGRVAWRRIPARDPVAMARKSGNELRKRSLMVFAHGDSRCLRQTRRSDPEQGWRERRRTACFPSWRAGCPPAKGAACCLGGGRGTRRRGITHREGVGEGPRGYHKGGGTSAEHGFLRSKALLPTCLCARVRNERST
jgi:hypothetical protein